MRNLQISSDDNSTPPQREFDREADYSSDVDDCGDPIIRAPNGPARQITVTFVKGGYRPPKIADDIED